MASHLGAYALHGVKSSEVQSWYDCGLEWLLEYMKNHGGLPVTAAFYKPLDDREVVRQFLWDTIKGRFLLETVHRVCFPEGDFDAQTIAAQLLGLSCTRSLNNDPSTIRQGYRKAAELRALNKRIVENVDNDRKKRLKEEQGRQNVLLLLLSS